MLTLKLLEEIPSLHSYLKDDNIGKVRSLTAAYPHVVEELEAQFGGILYLLEHYKQIKALIYGGVLRDIIAGMEFRDLDILVLNDYKATYNTFVRDPRWKMVGNDPTKSQYNDFHPFISYSTFANSNKREVQLIEHESSNSAKLHKFVSGGPKDADVVVPAEIIAQQQILSKIDLRCCCFFMDTSGNLFEFVEGAEEDCKNKVLQLNPNVKLEDLNIQRLEARINKFTKRGWSSLIDLEKIKNTKSSEPTLGIPQGGSPVYSFASVAHNPDGTVTIAPPKNEDNNTIKWDNSIKWSDNSYEIKFPSVEEARKKVVKAKNDFINPNSPQMTEMTATERDSELREHVRRISKQIEAEQKKIKQVMEDTHPTSFEFEPD